jgi:acyl-CoA dehydrogenase
MGARNGVNTGGIEHKMGIKGQATCVLNFDDAIAWRLGPKPHAAQARRETLVLRRHGGHVRDDECGAAGRGRAGHRAGRGRLSERHAYAHERRVGRALTGPKEPDKPADLEIVHPDVKRMLLHCRSFVEGARALACWTTLNMSIAIRSARTPRRRRCWPI